MHWPERFRSPGHCRCWGRCWAVPASPSGLHTHSHASQSRESIAAMKPSMSSRYFGAGAAAVNSGLTIPARSAPSTKTYQLWITNIAIDGGTFIFKEFSLDINKQILPSKRLSCKHQRVGARSHLQGDSSPDAQFIGPRTTIDMRSSAYGRSSG
jgi:hypothetical protein